MSAPRDALSERVARRVRVTVARYRHALQPSLSDAALLRRAGGPGCDVSSLVASFAARDRFFAATDARRITRQLDRTVPEWTERTVRDAERIQAGQVRLLGADSINVRAGPERDRDGCGHPSLRWHEDLLSGYRWNPRRYYRQFEVPVNQADIKIPWELSRCQHLPILGMAYRASGNAAFVDEIIAQITDWMRSNRPGYGINWATAMEVAIRSVNWLWAYRLVADAPQVTDAFTVRLLASLLTHGRHIVRNIEGHAGGITTNHTLANYVGLVYLGLELEGLPEADEWLETGLNGIVECMAYQVAPDGAHFESSISYHRLVTEMFLGSYVLAEQSGRYLPEEYRSSLERMLEFTYYYTRPDGLAPLMGDNDDGRLQILCRYFQWNPQDHRHLLAIGAVLYNRGDFASVARTSPDAIEHTAWILGVNAVERLAAFPEESGPRVSRSFRASGRFVMRHGKHYALVGADAVGTAGLGSHKHNDILAYDLTVDGVPMIVDPGTGAYMRNVGERNRFRSTRAHNTVMVDGREQNEMIELFSMGCDAQVDVMRWDIDPGLDVFEAEHTGYQRLPDPITHRRLILFAKNPFTWLVLDTLLGEGEHFAESFVHLAPGGEVKAPESHHGASCVGVDSVLGRLDRAGTAVERLEPACEYAVSYARGGVTITVVPINVQGMTVDNGWFSPRYGQRVPAPVLRLPVRVPAGRDRTTFGYVCLLTHPLASESTPGRATPQQGSE
jgi:hypothetical protein